MGCIPEYFKIVGIEHHYEIDKLYMLSDLIPLQMIRTKNTNQFGNGNFLLLRSPICNDPFHRFLHGVLSWFSIVRLVLHCCRPLPVHWWWRRTRRPTR